MSTYDASSALTCGVCNCNVSRAERWSPTLERFLEYLLCYFVDLFGGDLVIALHTDLTDSGSTTTTAMYTTGKTTTPAAADAVTA